MLIVKRVCGRCEREFESTTYDENNMYLIDQDLYAFKNAAWFVCSDCILEEGRRLRELESNDEIQDAGQDKED